MEKKPFLSLEQAKDIIKDIPTPFHIYDEKGIRENARALNKAFSWNKGFKEYFAVKATPNPYLCRFLRKRVAVWTAPLTQSFCFVNPAELQAVTLCSAQM